MLEGRGFDGSPVLQQLADVKKVMIKTTLTTTATTTIKLLNILFYRDVSTSLAQVR